MNKPKRTKASGLLPLGELINLRFSIAHCCPATLPKNNPDDDIGDWTKFKLVGNEGDLFVFECTKCSQSVAIDMESTVSKRSRR